MSAVDDSGTIDPRTIEPAIAMAAQCWCDPETRMIEMDHRLANAFAKRLRQLMLELERERLRLAACGVVALANTQAAALTARSMHPDYHSGSLDDVKKAVDREMLYRAALQDIATGTLSVDEARDRAQLALDGKAPLVVLNPRAAWPFPIRGTQADDTEGGAT